MSEPLPPLRTLCGMCNLRPVDGFYNPAPCEKDVEGLKWRIPETRFYLIVTQHFYKGFSVGLHTRPRIELRMRLELMESDAIPLAL